MTDRQPGEVWMTYAELAQIYGVPEGTLRRWQHDDRWERKRRPLRPVRWRVADAQASYDIRRSDSGST